MSAHVFVPLLAMGALALVFGMVAVLQGESPRLRRAGIGILIAVAVTALLLLLTRVSP